MDEEYDFEDKLEQEVLLSFTANKGHRTRQYKKITNLLALQEQKYSKSTEKTLLQAVSALERYQDRLTIFASWLNLHTLESAAAHVTEAETLPKAAETLVNKVIEHGWDLVAHPVTQVIGEQALVDILDLSEVDIPAGGFLYPAVGWG